MTILLITLCWFLSLWAFVAEGSVAGDQQAFGGGWRMIIGFPLALGAGVLLIWRARWPFVVTLVAAIPPICFVSDSAATLVALGWLAAANPPRLRLVIGAVVSFAATSLALWYDAQRIADFAPMQWLFGASAAPDHAVVPLPAVLVIALLLTAIPLGIGLLIGARRAVDRGAVRQQELQTEVTRREERGRIAREMHDVLGHRLSLLNLQAGALEVSADPQQAPEMAKLIRGTTTDALSDLRQVIGVLRDEPPSRPDRSEPDRLAPNRPGLAELPQLIEQSRRAGAGINVTVLLDQPAAAAADLGTAVYRVVQESITNALRHAPGLPLDVTVRGGPGIGVTVEAANPIAASSAGPSPGAGRGLTGMAERVTALGGRISSGPTDQGRFVVAAWLPWQE
ncbi:Signal transduction histidine kinase [Microlunatus soli]|uniref:histidine kinase n=1 Tax=Microlunatus soli TaxID=630515 RepID=A0A1H1WY70_9ACTN|nr:Signal transduction histidine kinase [Microlunatus soli]